MPVIKITDTSKGSNKGTCAFLEKYLQKENTEKDFGEQSYWYDHERNYVARGEVVNRVDKNHKGLGKDDAKFFMVTINYSSKELDYMNEKYPDMESFSAIKKQYTREVMEIYAANFKKNISGMDLLYFAMDETNRYYKGNSPDVQNGLEKQGDIKEGNNDHTHIIVSRRDKQQRFKLSPLTNHMDSKKGAVKGGFNRVDLKLLCETAFDQLVGYKRDFDERAEYLIRKARGEELENNADIAVKVDSTPNILKKANRIDIDSLGM